jgi:hypothetical protein
MSKIEWEKPILGTHTGTDGLGVVVNCKQVQMGTPFLHIDLVVYLETSIADPRPAIEAAIQTLREELGMES